MRSTRQERRRAADPWEIQGIDARTAAKLRRVEGVGIPGAWDVWSAVCRPGSWEWATAAGEDARAILRRAGYAERPDPRVTWRVRWELLARAGPP